MDNTFETLANQLIKYLNDNYSPHAQIIITPTSAELLEAVQGFSTDQFVRD